MPAFELGIYIITSFRTSKRCFVVGTVAGYGFDYSSWVRRRDVRNILHTVVDRMAHCDLSPMPAMTEEKMEFSLH